MIEELLDVLYGNRKNYKGNEQTKYLLINNPEFRNMIIEGIKENKINGFSEELWVKIANQNVRGINSFEDVFEDGANIDHCTVASKQLSYSFNSCLIAGGTNKYLINSPFAKEKDGRHTWIIKNQFIYDTTFMLIISKDYEQKLGYIEENAYDPNMDSIYLATKEFTNDKSLRAAIK